MVIEIAARGRERGSRSGGKRKCRSERMERVRERKESSESVGESRSEGRPQRLILSPFRIGTSCSRSRVWAKHL